MKRTRNLVLLLLINAVVVALLSPAAVVSSRHESHGVAQAEPKNFLARLEARQETQAASPQVEAETHETIVPETITSTTTTTVPSIDEELAMMRGYDENEVEAESEEAESVSEEQELLEVAPQAAPPIPMGVSEKMYSNAVEQWRTLVLKYFGKWELDNAMAVLDCESEGNPDAQNPSSTRASGLFQHLPRYWEDRSTRAGWAGADIFDPIANVAVAAWLQQNHGWGHWECWGMVQGT